MADTQFINLAPQAKDLTRKSFGRWSVLGPVRTEGGQVYWLCKCSCDVERVICGANLRAGRTKSCGCYNSDVQRKRKTTHGLTGTAEYDIYRSMKDRCYNQNNDRYHRYGGRGITVCDRWLKSAKDFCDDMGPRPGTGYSIERKNNEGGYEPENCYWATAKQQSNNTSANITLSFDGETLTLKQWSRKTGLEYGTIRARLKYGWTVERTLTEPTRRRSKCL